MISSQRGSAEWSAPAAKVRKAHIIAGMKVKLIKMWEDEDLTPEEVSDLITRNDVWEVTDERDGIYTLYTERDGVGEEAWVPCECVLEVE